MTCRTVSPSADDGRQVLLMASVAVPPERPS